MYVDNIILIGDCFEETEYLKEVLGREFEIKDLGQLKYFLGTEVARSHKGISVSQRMYTLRLAEGDVYVRLQTSYNYGSYQQSSNGGKGVVAG